jgi:hypothetical protein
MKYDPALANHNLLSRMLTNPLSSLAVFVWSARAAFGLRSLFNQFIVTHRILGSVTVMAL